MKKTTFTLAAILLAFMVLLNGCMPQEQQNQPLPGQEKRTAEVPAVNNTTPAPAKAPREEKLSCEEWAASLYPEQWVFQQDVTQDPKLTREVLSLREGSWKDGSGIRGISSAKIQLGSETGENVNYYYTKPIFITIDAEKYGFSYYNKVVSQQGIVLGENSFRIRPVFKVLYDTVKDENNTQNITYRIRYLSLLIVSPNLENCTRVE